MKIEIKLENSEQCNSCKLLNINMRTYEGNCLWGYEIKTIVKPDYKLPNEYKRPEQCKKENGL